MTATLVADAEFCELALPVLAELGFDGSVVPPNDVDESALASCDQGLLVCLLIHRFYDAGRALRFKKGHAGWKVVAATYNSTLWGKSQDGIDLFVGLPPTVDSWKRLVSI